MDQEAKEKNYKIHVTNKKTASSIHASLPLNTSLGTFLDSSPLSEAGATAAP